MKKVYDSPAVLSHDQIAFETRPSGPICPSGKGLGRGKGNGKAKGLQKCIG